MIDAARMKEWVANMAVRNAARDALSHILAIHAHVNNVIKYNRLVSCQLVHYFGLRREL